MLFLDGLGHEGAHPLGGVLLHFICHMGIGVKREARAVVAQDAGDGFCVYTLLDFQSRKGVPLWHSKD